jgi:Flp pilus assembly protein protease CpaA
MGTKKPVLQGEKVMNQKYALIAITIGLLMAGWMDGQDARLMATDKDSLTVACTQCAGGVR